MKGPSQWLAFFGVSAGPAEVRFGKQWSAFYSVAVFSDPMPSFAGSGTGVYAANSDGSIAGTGRADQALQFSSAIAAFKYGLQVQIRSETENDRTFADTFGASLTWEMNDRMQIGGAYNEVRDGVPDPELGQPRQGDRAFIVGYRYQKEKLYAGSTMTLFDNHDTDDQRVYFGGIGIEAYASYQWTDKLLRLVLLARLDFSKLSDGSDRDGDVVSLAVFYNF